jgi:hypothetical protein
MFHTAQSIGGYRGGPSGAYGDAQTGPTRSPLSPSGGSPGDRVRRRSDGLLAALEGLSMQDAGCDFPRTRLLGTSVNRGKRKGQGAALPDPVGTPASR